MNVLFRVVAVFALIVLAALGWGYWRSSTYASAYIRIEDYGLRTSERLYDTPNQASIEFFDAQGKSLAIAATVGPQHGYLSASHPGPKIGTCYQYDGYAQRKEYARCFDAHSRWVAEWAPRAHRARVQVGNCRLNDVPVAVDHSNQDWWLWWVPLPHVGGTPLGYFSLSVSIDSKACALPKT